MILTKEIEVTIINHNFHHYKNLGYDVKCRQKIKVPIEHLSHGSNLRVDVECDKCRKRNKLKYQDYISIINRSGEYLCNTCSLKRQAQKKEVSNISQLKEVKEKKIQTNLKNWGTVNVFQNEEIKKKCRNTCVKKYGVNNFTKTDEYIRKTKSTNNKKYGSDYYLQSEQHKKLCEQKYFEKNGRFPVIKNPEFKKYKNSVIWLTNQHKKELLNNWDGTDFYDNEYIKENFNLHFNNRSYPTIDHKISIYHGFINNIPAKKISEIENLCFTKRCINSRKHIKCKYKN